jgi:hypothetical protein
VLGAYGDVWVWIAFSPAFKLVPAWACRGADLGGRTQAHFSTLHRI